MTSGTVATADGLTYDMASSEDRQRMMDEKNGALDGPNSARRSLSWIPLPW